MLSEEEKRLHMRLHAEALQRLHEQERQMRASLVDWAVFSIIIIVGSAVVYAVLTAIWG